MKALISLESFRLNKVIELAEVPFDIHPDCGYWVDCDESVTTDHYYIDGVFKEYAVSDEEYLALLKEEKIAEIKALRDLTVGEPTPKDGSAISYNVDGVDRVFRISLGDLGTIQCILDLLRRKKTTIIAQATEAGLAASTDKESSEYIAAYNAEYLEAVITHGLTRGWSDVNGVRRELTEELFQSLNDHILDRDNTQRSLYVQRKEAISALTTIEEVKAYDINTIYEI